MTPEQEFSQSLEAHRQHRGWSQNELSRRLLQRGVDLKPHVLMRLEKVVAPATDLRHLRLDEAVAIAGAFEVSLAQMLDPCRNCWGSAPAGFICGTCGRGAS